MCMTRRLRKARYQRRLSHCGLGVEKGVCPYDIRKGGQQSKNLTWLVLGDTFAAFERFLVDLDQKAFWGTTGGNCLDGYLDLVNRERD
jgi:hypothetical protein